MTSSFELRITTDKLPNRQTEHPTRPFLYYAHFLPNGLSLDSNGSSELSASSYIHSCMDIVWMLWLRGEPAIAAGERPISTGCFYPDPNLE